MPNLMINAYHLLFLVWNLQLYPRYPSAQWQSPKAHNPALQQYPGHGTLYCGVRHTLSNGTHLMPLNIDWSIGTTLSSSIFVQRITCCFESFDGMYTLYDLVLFQQLILRHYAAPWSLMLGCALKRGISKHLFGKVLPQSKVHECLLYVRWQSSDPKSTGSQSMTS